MMPYFFAGGHTNYVLYGLCYLRTMHELSRNILDAFMKGEHVMRHQDGLWNVIWSVMIIETTYMRYSKRPGGISGATSKSRSESKAKIYAYMKDRHTLRIVLQLCSHLLDLDSQDNNLLINI